MRALEGSAPRLVPIALAMLGALPAAAQGLPPWVDPGRLPLPDEARTIEVLREGEPLFVEPHRGAARRGAAARGAVLPIHAAREGPGCRLDWVLVGGDAWLCSEGGRVGDQPPTTSAEPPATRQPGLPHDYFFVGSDGAFAYSRLETAEETRPSAELQPDYAVAVVARARQGDPLRELGLTTKGLWVPVRDLRPVTAPSLAGHEVGAEGLAVGFVLADDPAPRSEPGGRRAEGVALRRFDKVPVLERRADRRGKEWIRVAPGAWLETGAVRTPVAVPPPPEVGPAERWIDVDRERQLVTAYEGARPVFVALASTGKGREGEPTVTPPGVHRVWVKLRTSDMTNLEDDSARRYYAMQEVPWVLFFKGGYGLHGAFWHRSFGSVRSHGCVNLSPVDAARLFEFAGPRLPPGWTAALPTEYDPGTVVLVR